MPFSAVSLPRSVVFTRIQVGLQTWKNHFSYINKTLAKIGPWGNEKINMQATQLLCFSQHRACEQKSSYIVQLVFCDKLGNDTVVIALKQNTPGEYKVLYQ